MRIMFFSAIVLLIISGCFGQADNKAQSEIDTIKKPFNESVELGDNVDFTVDTFIQFSNGKIFGNSKNQGEEDLFLSEDNPPKNIDEVSFFVKQFMPETRADSFLQAIKLYKKIETDTALINFYRNEANIIADAIVEGMRLSHPDVMYAGDDSPAQGWAWIKDFAPMRATCLSSEGESEAYKYLPDFMEKSKTTEGNLDNELFTLLNYYYDDYDDIWLTIGYDNAGCDYCGYSTFGNGSQIKLFKEIIKVEGKTDFLDKELEKLLTSMMDFGGTAFGSPKSDIIKEIDQFLELKDSTRFDISKLEKEKEKLNDPTKKFMFECKYEDFMEN